MVESTPSQLQKLFFKKIVKKKLKKLIPNKEALTKSKVFSPIAHWLIDTRFCRLNKRSVSVGVSIGLFFGCLPIPGQMLFSALASIFFNANIAIAIGVTWYSNPLTMPFIFTGQYYLGSYLLDSPSINLEQISFSFDSLSQMGGNILLPIFLGAIIAGCTLSLLSLILVRIVWRVRVVSDYNDRRIKRQKFKKQ